MSDLMEQASEACEDALSALKDCVMRCTVALNSEEMYDKDLVCHLAFITKEVIAIMTGIKKLQADLPVGADRGAELLFR